MIQPRHARLENLRHETWHLHRITGRRHVRIQHRQCQIPRDAIPPRLHRCWSINKNLTRRRQPTERDPRQRPRLHGPLRVTGTEPHEAVIIHRRHRAELRRPTLHHRRRRGTDGQRSRLIKLADEAGFQGQRRGHHAGGAGHIAQTAIIRVVRTRRAATRRFGDVGGNDIVRARARPGMGSSGKEQAAENQQRDEWHHGGSSAAVIAHGLAQLHGVSQTHQASSF